MISIPHAQGKTYYVVGLGRSGQAAAKSLIASGADVRVWDDNDALLNGFDEKQIRSPEKAPWSSIKAVIMAPGIPPSHPVIAMANEKLIPVLCDIDLFAQSAQTSKVIGVTGTNGKSTTTALIHHILNYKNKAQMGGNIGISALSLKDNADYTVLELSSYHLDRSPHLACDIAILLNITPDHLDWHGSFENYVQAKANIFNNAKQAIISVDDELSQSIAEQHPDALKISIYNEDIPFNPSDFPRLKGTHNLQNMLAAYHACLLLDLDHDLIIERMKSFEGLAHRQYLVRLINGIPYVNDSKATNVDAAKMALKAFRNIIWIAGGRQKEGGLTGLDGDLGQVKKAYLIGEAEDDFARFLSVRGVEVETCHTLENAVTLAHHYAQDLRGEPTGAPTVLFSPACASFDQYPNFEKRGEHFVTLVKGLSDE